MEQRQKHIVEGKNILSEQVQVEMELCAEIEEVRIERRKKMLTFCNEMATLWDEIPFSYGTKGTGLQRYHNMTI